MSANITNPGPGAKAPGIEGSNPIVFAEETETPAKWGEPDPGMAKLQEHLVDAMSDIGEALCEIRDMDTKHPLTGKEIIERLRRIDRATGGLSLVAFAMIPLVYPECPEYVCRLGYRDIWPEGTEYRR
jgi:hypothetical protein